MVHPKSNEPGGDIMAAARAAMLAWLVDEISAICWAQTLGAFLKPGIDLGASSSLASIISSRGVMWRRWLTNGSSWWCSKFVCYVSRRLYFTSRHPSSPVVLAITFFSSVLISPTFARHWDMASCSPFLPRRYVVGISKSRGGFRRACASASSDR